ncbi:MAG TPA: tripartite tricarboxylate transporter substrate-binding protein [Burkholderiales bacterium]|nr:tripartite tricarboxylate transporter substrate-binding protein [Burkholderiales bacterium]
MKKIMALSPGVVAIALVVLFTVAATAAAQDYPTRPIRWLVPFAPGGVGDLTARIVAQKMTENLHQQVVIDNRPAAGMVVSANIALQAPPDGYTLIQAGNGSAISQSLFKALPYDVVKDFTAVSTLAYFDIVLVTNANSAMNTVADVLAYAKKNPGKLSIGTGNIGTTQYLAVQLLTSMASINAQTIPFKATPVAINALRGNEIPLVVETVPALIGQLKGGALKALAVGSTQRSPILPDTPTLAESGVPGYEATSWTGISVKAKTPEAIIARLHREISAAVKSGDVMQKLGDMGATGRASASPEEARKLMRSEIDKWKVVIDRVGIERQ